MIPNNILYFVNFEFVVILLLFFFLLHFQLAIIEDRHNMEKRFNSLPQSEDFY